MTTKTKPIRSEGTHVITIKCGEVLKHSMMETAKREGRTLTDLAIQMFDFCLAERERVQRFLARSEAQKKIYRHILLGCSDYSLWAIIRMLENGQADTSDVEAVGGDLLVALVEHKKRERERDQAKA